MTGITLGTEDFQARSDVWGSFLSPVRRIHDSLRYMDRAYVGAEFLRKRYEERLPEKAAFLARWPALPGPAARLARRGWGLLEHLAPTDPEMEEALRALAPDVIVVSPLIEKDPTQPDLVRSARALGIPTVACIASWDNLTTKGLIYVRPDRLIMWNAIQAKEAEVFHNYPRSRIAITGAQSFDRWFDRPPTVSREAFTARLGLPPGSQYVLFTGSSAQISPGETEARFVREWARALRAKLPERWRDVALVVRPHPLKYKRWAEIADPDLGLTVFPAGGANPVDEQDRADYYHSLYYASAVVGLNTSAMVEATILDKPVLTILAEHANQRETLHFRYLLKENGGYLLAAKDLDEHAAQLADALDSPDKHLPRTRAFVENFIRPRGRSRDAQSVVVEEILATARLPRKPTPTPHPALRPFSRWLETKLPVWIAGQIAADAERNARAANKASLIEYRKEREADLVAKLARIEARLKQLRKDGAANPQLAEELASAEAQYEVINGKLEKLRDKMPDPVPVSNQVA